MVVSNYSLFPIYNTSLNYIPSSGLSSVKYTGVLSILLYRGDVSRGDVSDYVSSCPVISRITSLLLEYFHNDPPYLCMLLPTLAPGWIRQVSSTCLHLEVTCSRKMRCYMSPPILKHPAPRHLFRNTFTTIQLSSFTHLYILTASHHSLRNRLLLFAQGFHCSNVFTSDSPSTFLSSSPTPTSATTTSRSDPAQP